MDWLEPPLQLFNPPEDVPVILPVVRWEVGLVNIPRSDRAGNVVKPAIRFHLAGPGAWGIRPYADFSHQLLLRRVLRLYNDAGEALRLAGDQVRTRAVSMTPEQLPGLLTEQRRIIDEGSKWLPSYPDAFVRIRVIRRGAHPDSTYEVDVVGP